MPTLDFPDVPFAGQLYQIERQTFIYNGVGWQRFGNQGSPFVLPGPNNFAFIQIYSFVNQ
jgi:hypothetical protein